MTTTIYDASKSADEIDVVVVTDCLDIDRYTEEFSDALLVACRSVTNKTASQVGKLDPFKFSRVAMARAFKVGFKVAGYKADDVGERRLLSCGPANYSDSSILGDSRGAAERIK